MFLHPISTTSITSGAAYSYSDEIDLRHKHNDDKNLSLVGNICSNSASGLLNVIAAICNTSGGTFATFITASGASTLIVGGTSSTGQFSNGSYIVPLTIAPGGGVTLPLKGVPVIKFGFQCTQADCDVSFYLAVG